MRRDQGLTSNCWPDAVRGGTRIQRMVPQLTIELNQPGVVNCTGAGLVNGLEAMLIFEGPEIVGRCICMCLPAWTLCCGTEGLSTRVFVGSFKPQHTGTYAAQDKAHTRYRRIAFDAWHVTRAHPHRAPAWTARRGCGAIRTREGVQSAVSAVFKCSPSIDRGLSFEHYRLISNFERAPRRVDLGRPLPAHVHPQASMGGRSIERHVDQSIDHPSQSSIAHLVVADWSKQRHTATTWRPRVLPLSRTRC